MSAKTQLTEQQLHDFLSNFPIPPVQSIDFIAAGSENSNYIVRTGAKKYILTILEDTVDQAILPYIRDVFVALESRNALTPSLITALDGKRIRNIIPEKKAVLQTFLEGCTEHTPTEEQCFAAGRALASIHNTLKDTNLGFMPNRYNHNGLSMILTEKYDNIANHSPRFATVLASIKSTLEDLDTAPMETLPEGPIHGVFFRENVLFTEEMITGVIDLWFSCTDSYLYDLCLALVDFGFINGSFIDDNFNALKDGYTSIRPLENTEIQLFDKVMSLAAIRLALTYMISHVDTEAPRNRNQHDIEDVLLMLDYVMNNNLNNNI